MQLQFEQSTRSSFIDGRFIAHLDTKKGQLD